MSQQKANETRRVKVRCAVYEVDRETFHIPHACIDCHKKGLVLLYNAKKHRMEALCAAREDQKGQFIAGCSKNSFVIPMTKRQFDVIANDPHTTDYFFVMQTLP